MKLQPLEERHLLDTTCLNPCCNTYTTYGSIDGCVFERAADNFAATFSAANAGIVGTPELLYNFATNLQSDIDDSLYQANLAWLNDFYSQLETDITCFENNFDTSAAANMAALLQCNLEELSSQFNYTQSSITRQLIAGNAQLTNYADLACVTLVAQQMVYPDGNCTLVDINSCVDHMYNATTANRTETLFNAWADWCTGHDAEINVANYLSAFIF